MKAIAKYLPQIETIDGPQGVKITHNTGSKMFATTHDIKEGDDLHIYMTRQYWGKLDSLSKDGDRNIAISGDMKIWWNDNAAQPLLKILGPISPNATWVQDGDEVEVFPKPFVRYENDKRWYNPMGGLPFKEEKSFMGVKCPTCNTYH